ncbi:hypothetical protein DID88_009288 [Monilinia fructigena]|uniref:Uncharacterized protein n=1 Tax=Monilinia fructigena TaxID=38457 RepID=A0A395IHG2_9HELO|nr:hypothetical protein DID88_009288 [Monilinia fructigena]
MDNHKLIENANFRHVNLIATSTATAYTLRYCLRSLAIPFEPNAQKLELQALCSLHELGVVQTGCTADQILVHQVGVWWEMNLKARLEELERLGFDDTGKQLRQRGWFSGATSDEESEEYEEDEEDSAIAYYEDNFSEELYEDTDDSSSDSSGEGEDEDEEDDFDLELWLGTEESD